MKYSSLVLSLSYHLQSESIRCFCPCQNWTDSASVVLFWGCYTFNAFTLCSLRLGSLPSTVRHFFEFQPGPCRFEARTLGPPQAQTWKPMDHPTAADHLLISLVEQFGPQSLQLGRQFVNFHWMGAALRSLGLQISQPQHRIGGEMMSKICAMAETLNPGRATFTKIAGKTVKTGGDKHEKLQ